MPSCALMRSMVSSADSLGGISSSGKANDLAVSGADLLAHDDLYSAQPLRSRGPLKRP